MNNKIVRAESIIITSASNPQVNIVEDLVYSIASYLRVLAYCVRAT